METLENQKGRERNQSRYLVVTGSCIAPPRQSIIFSTIPPIPSSIFYSNCLESPDTNRARISTRSRDVSLASDRDQNQVTMAFPFWIIPVFSGCVWLGSSKMPDSCFAKYTPNANSFPCTRRPSRHALHMGFQRRTLLRLYARNLAAYCLHFRHWRHILGQTHLHHHLSRHGRHL